MEWYLNIKLKVLIKIMLAPWPPMMPIKKRTKVVKLSAVLLERSMSPAMVWEIARRRPPMTIVFLGPYFL